MSPKGFQGKGACKIKKMKKECRSCGYNPFHEDFDDNDLHWFDCPECPWEWCSECGGLLNPQVEAEAQDSFSCTCAPGEGAQKIPLWTLMEAYERVRSSLPDLTIEEFYELCQEAEDQDWIATANAQKLADWVLKQ
ncbi:MAG: hypothetical protein HYY20_11505 [Candidatus Tectomicrobia bacterium]|uniref:Uncharacterized protein n=1 Tax=Tectimicrobiota bacterium TaxID=2528274 RepID=A0A932FZH7_UNCTE|nr:hypothetical protein [Candidatus Tectomicrobia bacterium]